MSKGDVTRLLESYSAGDRAALDELLGLVYQELRQVARTRMRGERAGHTLQTTALVHEAYLKLARLDRIEYRNRAHFFAIAARAMRNVLVDYAVRRDAEKRGGGRLAVPLEEARLADSGPSVDLMALDEAIERLEALEPRHARVVECRLLAGLSIDETAEALDISAATVSRDWAVARAWLNRELTRDKPEEAG